jgi:hypothetical protein
MTEKERFQRAFAPLHASPDTMTEVTKMTERKTKRPALRRAATIGLAAALVLALWQRDGDHVEADAPDPLAHLGAETRADVTKELERIRARSAEGWPGWDGYLSED